MKRQFILGITLGTSLLLAPSVLAAENSVPVSTDENTVTVETPRVEKVEEKEATGEVNEEITPVTGKASEIGRASCRERVFRAV